MELYPLALAGNDVCGGGAPFAFKHGARPFDGSFGTAIALRAETGTLFPVPIALLPVPIVPVELPCRFAPPLALLEKDLRLTGSERRSGATPLGVPPSGPYASGDVQAAVGEDAKGPWLVVGVFLKADGARSADDCRDTPFPFHVLFMLGFTNDGATKEAGRGTLGH